MPVCLTDAVPGSEVPQGLLQCLGGTRDFWKESEQIIGVEPVGGLLLVGGL